MTSARAVEPPQAPASLPCRLDLPDTVEPAARYAVEELLRPLGLCPDWRAADGAPTGLWYGLDGGPTPPGWLRIPMGPLAARWMAEGGSTVPGDVAWHDRSGRRVPDLFPDGRAPDPVANAFFWLSGAQERAVAGRDRHGRFTLARSLQGSLGVGDDAPVDDMRDILADRLVEAGVRLHPRRWGGRSWALCPTFDVDYTRKWRPGIIWRETVQNLILNQRRESVRRRMARFGRALADMATPGDPYRSAMDRIPAEVERVGGTSTWFFKAGAHGPNDVGYRIDSAALGRRMGRLRSSGHEIGLHPSYHAAAHEGYVAVERDRLARASGEAPVALRLHYLRWKGPETARMAVRLGFRIDSTLGYPDGIGFRNGTTMPFRPWDPAAGRASDLWEFPLAVMESALFVRRDLSGEDALAATERLASTVRRHGGVLVGLWHTTLWDEVDFPGWGEHFVRALDRAHEEGGAVLGLARALASWSCTGQET